VVSALRDMVFDHANHLFVTTEDGFVWRYDIATQSFGTFYFLGGSLNGLDITADDRFLVIAQNDAGITDGIFHRLDLVSGEVSNISLPSDRRGEKGGWDVAIASNGSAFVTRRTDLVGPCQLRQVDLATNAIMDRSPMGPFYLINQDEPVRRSADRSRLYFVGSDSGGRVFTYDVVTDSFGPIISTEMFLRGAAAVSRDGSLVATRIGITASLSLALDHSPVHTFDGISGGVAFDAVRDRFYGVNAAADVISGYNTASFIEEVRIPIGEDVPSVSVRFGAGNMVASPDGHYLALLTTRALRLYDLTTAPPPPTPTPTPIPTPTPVPGGTPIVSVDSSAASIVEGTSGFFTVSAASNTARPVTINYLINGKAKFGTDYTLDNNRGASGQITIPVGTDSTTITVNALQDGFAESRKGEALTIKIAKGSGYKPVRRAQAKINILDSP